MFVLEFESSSPASAASYYSLVVRRDPYTIGRLPNCDVALPELSDVSRQHVKLEVLRASDALKLDPTADPTTNAFGSTAARSDGGDDVGLVSPAPPRVDRQIAFQASPQPSNDSPHRQRRDAVDDDDDRPYSGTPTTPTSFGCLEYCLVRVPGALTIMEDDPLVVRLTNLSQFGTRVESPPALDAAGDATPTGNSMGAAPATAVVQSSVFVHNGWRIHVGGQCVFRLTFRPVVVSVARDYAAAYIQELEATYRLLGATCMREVGPVPYTAPSTGSGATASLEHDRRRGVAQSSPPSRRGSVTIPSAASSTQTPHRRCQPLTPLLAAHVCEVIADDSWTLMALAAGYTMVEPTYVFEWYASLATSCRAPLHELPPPAHYSPQTKLSTYHTTPYLRPEPVTCPFTLYPMVGPTRGAPAASAHGNVASRTREGLMARKLFFTPSEITFLRNKAPLELCGGVVLQSLREVIEAGRSGGGGSGGLNPLALHARYIVLEDSIADAVRQTSVADLKAHSALRKYRSQHAAALPLSGSFDDASVIDNASLFSLPADAGLSAPHDNADVDDEEAMLRLLVKLYLLSKHQSWLLITERCVHVALLSNQFTFQTVTFPEAASSSNVLGDVDDASGAASPARGTTEGAVGRRDPRLEDHDEAVYGSILQRKMTGKATGASPNRRATDAHPQQQLPHGRFSPIGGTSHNGKAQSRKERDDDGAEEDSDKTPSVLSNDDDNRPLSDAHKTMGGLAFASPARTAMGNGDGSDAMMVTSPLPVPPLASVADPRHHHHHHHGVGTTGRGGVARAMTLTAFEAQAELLRRTIQKLLNPTDRERLQGIAAATRSQRALDPVDRSFVQHLLSAARVQLQALEALHVQGREAALTSSPPLGDVPGQGSTTRSRALMAMWNQCVGVVSLAEEVLSFHTAVIASSGGRLQQTAMPARSPLRGDDRDGDVNGGGFYDPNGSAIGVCRRPQQRGNVPSAHHGGLRPTTRMLRYPAPVASFLGPDVHRGGRVQLSDEHQLTARLLAPVQASNLAGVAEKRRLFIKRYQQEEGEKRFALWMQGNGAQWSIQLYRTLDERNMTLLEMLQYE